MAFLRTRIENLSSIVYIARMRVGDLPLCPFPFLPPKTAYSVCSEAYSGKIKAYSDKLEAYSGRAEADLKG